MSGLIEALQILLKYGDPAYPTHCEHDKLLICGIDAALISEDDRSRLAKLGFIVGRNDSSCGEVEIYSFRYGSA